nr:LysR substrate-binding domain-containing protein [uncultured Shinella sp.]
MDLRQLRYFIVIVEQGSFAKAAAVLNVAQPALSNHVRNMEADLRTPLLFRSPLGVVATEAGEILLRHARIILGQVAVAEGEIRGHEAEPEGEVRLGLPGTINEILSVPLIMAARRRLPKVKLRIAEAMSGFVLEWMQHGRIDLGVIYTSFNDKDLVSRQVLTEELCLFGPVEPLNIAKLAPGETLEYGEVAKLPLILPSAPHGLRELLEKKAAEIDRKLNTVIDVDSYGNIKELVEEGFGYSILPYNAIALELRQGRLVHRAIVNPVIERDVNLVHSATRPMTNAVRAVEELCRSTLLSLMETGRWKGVKAAPSDAEHQA